jgi:long-chain acyl-CoA synthetase
MDSLADLLRRNEKDHPDRAAVVTAGHDRLSHAELARRSRALAYRLRDHNVGGRIGLHYPEGDWTGFATGYLAALTAGLTAVVIPSDADRWTLRHLVDGTGLAAVLTPDGTEPPPGLDADLPRLSPERGGGADPGDWPRTEPGATGESGDVFYTSGSTGRPKGVAARRDQLEQLADTARRRPGGARTLGHGFSHTSAVAVRQLLLTCLARGTTLAVSAPFAADDFLRLVEDENIEVAVLPAATGRALLRQLEASGAVPPPSLRRLRFTTDHLSPDVHRALAERLPAADVLNTYGLTEAGDAHLVVRTADCDRGPGGFPAPGTQVRVQAEDGSWAPAGQEGVICLRDTRCADDPLTYAHDAGLARRTWRDGWTVTRDRGVLDADGRVRYTGRAEFLARVGGRSVSIPDVRQALDSHPDVTAAVVLPRPHPTLGQALTAVVETGLPASPDGLTAFLRDRLPAHAVPSRIVPVARIPLGRNGKPHARALRELVFGMPGESGRACETPTEHMVADAWQKALQLSESPGPDDEFVLLGGDSLAAVAMLERLEDELDTHIPTEVFFTARTLGDLARGLDELTGGPRL